MSTMDKDIATLSCLDGKGCGLLQLGWVCWTAIPSRNKQIIVSPVKARFGEFNSKVDNASPNAIDLVRVTT